MVCPSAHGWRGSIRWGDSDTCAQWEWLGYVWVAIAVEVSEHAAIVDNLIRPDGAWNPGGIKVVGIRFVVLFGGGVEEYHGIRCCGAPNCNAFEGHGLEFGSGNRSISLMMEVAYREEREPCVSIGRNMVD